MTPAGLSLLSNLLHWDPGNRWTAQQALAGIYFEEYPQATPTNAMPQFHGKMETYRPDRRVMVRFNIGWA